MNHIKIAVLSAFTVMSLGLATPGYAITVVTDDPCASGCDEEPEPRAKGNNGLGNGDQQAPGNSLENNKAENQVGNPGHQSGKPQESN